jgi:hypothetical protein
MLSNTTFSTSQATGPQRGMLGLGLRNGLLIGLALALGTWAPQVVSLFTIPVRLLYPPLILGGLAVLFLGGLGGWLSAWLDNSLGGALVWVGVAVLMSLVINHLPYTGTNLTVWLADRRFWGLPIYAFDAAAQVRLWLSGFFIVLLLAILGLLQDYRLEGAGVGFNAEGRLDARGWFSLALPLPLVFGVGLIADNIVNSPIRVPPQVIHEAIRTGRTYPGDLFELSRQSGFNYNAIAAVRDQMSESYVQFIGETESGSQTVLVVTHFDNGAWINCWVIGGNLTFCYDASPPYLQGFPALLTSGELPGDCEACAFQVDRAQRAWLQTRGADFTGPLRVTRVAQWGSYVRMRAEPAGGSGQPPPSGDGAIECLFHGIRQIKLERCWDAQGSSPKAGSSEAISGPAVAIKPSPSPKPTGIDARAPSSLAHYAPAMRPAFVDDLGSIGPITEYRIKVTVDPERADLSGQETVRYVNSATVQQDAVYFRLFPNLPGYGGTMTVSNLRIGKERIPAKLETQNTALRVPLPDPLPPGGQTEIFLDFRATVPLTVSQGYGEFIYLQDVMALANFFPLIPAYDEENCARFGNCDGGWNTEFAVPYGDAVFSASALFEVWVTAPADWTVVASGSTLEQQAGPEDTLTWHIVSGPMRDFNLVLSPRFEVASQKVEDITVNSYYLPEDAPGGRRVLRWCVEALEFFNEQLGPYPFSEFDIVATPNVALGIEYPGLIAMAIWNYGDTSGVFQWSTVHEVVHQWWYSLVGNDQQDEPWLDEALTQYSTGLFYELFIGWDAYVEEVFESSYQRVAGTAEDDLISRPVAAYSPSNYGPVVYGKGPLFFHALRQEMGDQAFTTLLQTYFDTYRYDIASGPDFLDLAEQISGQDLTDLFQEWLGDLY